MSASPATRRAVGVNRTTGQDGQRSEKAAIVGGTTVQQRLVGALMRSKKLGATAARIELLETHISYVLLTGTFAYKIKKTVDFGFLDFTTLAARRFFCEEELRLNRRLAPSLYLDVVPITGGIDSPIAGGSGPALEYAVKMREFPQDALASRLLAHGELGAADIDVLAAKVATFHGAIDVVAPDGAFGGPDEILAFARQNFTQMRPLLDTVAERDEIESLRVWTERAHAAHRDAFLERRERGFIRECHGDLHLGNIARVDGELVIFDCIEFNDAMRWIDVMSEVAFTVMDLQGRSRADLAHRLLNAYLELTGDYAGLAVLPFYLAYRALVRAKIARLRAAQLDPGPANEALLAEYRGYMVLARSYAQPTAPALIITCGLSGCGKTTISRALLETIGAVRVRSDIERKRLHGLTALDRSDAGSASELYAHAATVATYDRLRTVARDILVAGQIAIVDATFLLRAQREPFRALAAQLDIPFVILAFEAKEATLRERIAQRQAEGNDASDADLGLLESQIAAREPLADDEKEFAIAYDTETPIDAARAPAAWADLAARLAGGPRPGSSRA